MAPKKTKAKKISIVKSEAISKGSRPWWSELPPDLIHLPLHARYKLHHTNNPGITKSCLTTARGCNATEHHHQWLQLYNHLNNPSNNSSTSYRPCRSYLGDDSCIPGLSEWPNESYWCVLKVDTRSRFGPSADQKNAVLSLVQLAGIPSSTLMVDYRINCNRYMYKFVSIRHECTTVDPFDPRKRYMEFTTLVKCEGKFYALSMQGALVVMQDIDSRLRITSISTSRAVPSASSRFFKQYLFELDGEILLVFLIHQKSLGVVDQVEVFRLGFDKLHWIKVENLGGKTFFLDEYGMWANSAEICCRENCIYFTQGSYNDSWWIYDMEICSISPASSEE